MNLFKLYILKLEHSLNVTINIKYTEKPTRSTSQNLLYSILCIHLKAVMMPTHRLSCSFGMDYQHGPMEKHVCNTESNLITRADGGEVRQCKYLLDASAA